MLTILSLSKEGSDGDDKKLPGSRTQKANKYPVMMPSLQWSNQPWEAF